jgi:hypothetical protein
MCYIIGQIELLCLYFLGGLEGQTKEMHLVTIQALIDVYSKIRSSVADLSTYTSMCLSSKDYFSISTSNIVSNHLSPCTQ